MPEDQTKKKFGFIEGLLTVITLTLLVGVGFYIYNSLKDNDTKTVTTSNNGTSASTPVTTTAPTTTHTSQEAVTLTQSTYTNYLAALNAANDNKANKQPVAQVGLAAVKSSLGADLYAKAAAVTQATPFSCTSQYVTDKYTASLLSSTGNTAMIKVAIGDGAGGTNSTLTASVDLTSLTITAVTCN